MSDEAPTTPRPSPQQVAEKIVTELYTGYSVIPAKQMAWVAEIIAARDRSWEEEVRAVLEEAQTIYLNPKGQFGAWLDNKIAALRAELQREREKGTRGMIWWPLILFGFAAFFVAGFEAGCDFVHREKGTGK